MKDRWLMSVLHRVYAAVLMSMEGQLDGGCIRQVVAVNEHGRADLPSRGCYTGLSDAIDACFAMLSRCLST